MRDTPWSWPFVDVEFESDETVPWPTHIHNRPFAGFWLPAPEKPWKFLSRQFKSAANSEFKCASKFWSHVSLQYEVDSVVTVDCQVLASVYPFVHREYHSAKCTKENLLLKGKPLQSVIVREMADQQWMGLGNFTWV